MHIERLHERTGHIFRNFFFQGNTDIMAGIGSRACRLHVPARISVLPREIPELYAKPYSLTVNFQSLHFYFSCMHSARMLRSTGKYNTDCPVLSCNLSIDRLSSIKWGVRYRLMILGVVTYVLVVARTGDPTVTTALGSHMAIPQL